MVNKSIRMWILFTVIAASVIVAAAPIAICRGNNNAKDPNQTGQEQSAAQPKEPPIIIWFHSGASGSLLSLKTALSSGLITHVMILYMHRADGDWNANRRVREAIEMVKKSDAKLIWCRDLWPYYANENIKLTDIFDPNYYIQEIQMLRTEGREIGADSVALDTEPYGYSPLKKYLKGKNGLTREQREQLKRAVERTIKTVGKVDFLMPAGSMISTHPYNILAELGTNRISESTYYCNYERIKKIKTPYDIFGAYVKTVRRRDENPGSPYFLVSDVFERSQLWSDKKGVFLYTDKKEALAVAKELVAYAESLPNIINCIQKQKPNTGP